MEKSKSYEADSYLASQRISFILLNPIVPCALKSARHGSLSWARCIQYSPLNEGTR
jgi:hypothetical protein